MTGHVPIPGTLRTYMPNNNKDLEGLQAGKSVLQGTRRLRMCNKTTRYRRVGP